MVPAHAVPVPSSRGMQATARAKQTLLWAGTRQQIADGHSRVVGLYRFNFLRASNIDHCGGVRDGRLPLPIGRSMEYEASSIRWSETSEATGNGPCRWATRQRSNQAMPRARALPYLKYGPQSIGRTARRAYGPYRTYLATEFRRKPCAPGWCQPRRKPHCPGHVKRMHHAAAPAIVRRVWNASRIASMLRGCQKHQGLQPPSNSRPCSRLEMNGRSWRPFPPPRKSRSAGSRARSRPRPWLG